MYMHINSTRYNTGLYTCTYNYDRNKLQAHTFSCAGHNTKDEGEESEVRLVHDHIFFFANIQLGKEV